jgi:hypothetical protein
LESFTLTPLAVIDGGVSSASRQIFVNSPNFLYKQALVVGRRFELQGVDWFFVNGKGLESFNKEN